MDISRTGIEIGPFDIFGLTLNPTLHFYGLLIVTGILLGANLAAWLAKEDEKDPDVIWNGLIWTVALGIVGARLWFVLFPPITSVEAGKDTAWLLRNFFDLNEGPLAVWSGGLGIYGAVFGGLVGVLTYARRAKLANVWEWIDIAIIGVPLGQAIGRWGNYLNQELYGKPTSLPWAISIDNPPAEFAGAQGFHPLFLYESLWNLAVCALLFWLWMNRRHILRPGSILLVYLIAYPAMRFMLEFIRIETAHVPGFDINSSQLTSAISVIVASALLFYRQRRIGPRTHPDGRPVGRPKKKKAR